MPTRPLISAICLTEDRPDWLPRAVDLFRAQDWPNKELLILDRSAPDRRAELPYDECIRRWYFPKHTPQSARNRVGITAARGELVTYWDDDDYHSRDRLRLQAEPILAGEAAVTGIRMSAGYTVTLPGPKFWRTKWGVRPAPEIPPPVEDPKPTWPDLGFMDATTMFRKAVVKDEHDPALEHGKIDFLREVIARDQRIVRLDHPWLYAYVRHGRNEYKLPSHCELIPQPQPPWFDDKQISFWQNAGWSGAGDGR